MGQLHCLTLEGMLVSTPHRKFFRRSLTQTYLGYWVAARLTPHYADIMSVQAKPEGYTTVTPWLISSDTASLIRFMEQAFGATEIAHSRIHDQDGRIGHVEVQLGDAIIMLFDAKDDWPATPAFLRLYVEDSVATYEQALVAGATPVTEVTELSFGDLVGRVCDPWGNIWWLQTHIKDVSPEEMAAPSSELIEKMTYVQQTLDNEMSRREVES